MYGATDAPLVGRAAELRALDRALAAARSGRAATVVVLGEPGIGKTRLLDELIRVAARGGCRVARGWPGELERDIPYAPVTQALEPVLGRLAGRLREVLPEERFAELAAVFSTLPRPVGGARPLLAVERHRLFAAVRAALAELVRTRPCVLALDDLHWADGGTVELIHYLVHRAPVDGLVLALAYRPRQAGTALLSTVEAADAVRLPLGPLSEVDVAGLVPADDAQRLHRASGGNPLYLQALARGGSLALRGEFDGLSPQVRDIGLLAAVVGDVVRPAVLTAVAGGPAAPVLAAVDELVARDILRESGGALRFRHPVLRHVGYALMPPGRRLAAHRRVARVLQARGVSLAERAHHIERAAAPGDAEAAYLLARAADESVARAPATAVRWYAAALRLLPQHDDTTRLSWTVMYADALVNAGRLADAAEALRAARALPSAEDPAVRAWLAGLVGQAYNLLGQHDRAADLLTGTLSAVDGPVSAALTVELAQVSFWRRDFPAMRMYANRALACTVDDDGLRVDAGAQRAFADFQLGHVELALSGLDAASARADGLTDDAFVGRAGVLCHLGHIENVLGRHGDALRHLDRALEVARWSGQGYLMPLLRCDRTLALLHHGRLAEAAEEAQTALDDAGSLANELFRTMALLGCTWAARDRGDLVGAVRHGEQALAAGRALGPMAAAFAGLYLAEALCDLGEPERAVTVLLTSAGNADLAPIEPTVRPRAYELLVRAALDRDDVRAASEHAERALACPVEEFPRSRLFVHRSRAAVLAAQHRYAEAAALASAAVRDASTAAVPLELARSRLLLGRIQAAQGDRDAAARVLAQAEADLAFCGAARDRDLAARSLRELGLGVPRRLASGSPAVLSGRERQVAELVAVGRTNRQIATQLHISENTVETHLRRIFAKLAVSSRAAVGGLLR